MRHLILTVVVLTGAGGALRAQRGRTPLLAGVADANTGAPLQNAEVAIPDVGLSARTDVLGEARIALVPDGRHHLRVRRLGYATADVDLEFHGDTVGPVFMLEPVASQLPGVHVVEAASSAALREFETRRVMGFGHFITDSVLRTEGDHALPIVLVSHLPGIRVAATPASPTAAGGGRMHGGGGGATASTRSSSGDNDFFSTPGELHIEALGPSGILFDSKPVCPVDVYLNGFIYRESLEVLSTRTVLGVELYDKGAAPPQYRRQGKACKVLLIWTGAPRDP